MTKLQECFAKAINLDPDFAGARRNYGYVLYCNYQMQQLKEDHDPDEIDENVKHDDVMECLNKAIELDPGEPYAWFYRAYIYFFKKEYDNALGNFEKAIQIKSSLYDAWMAKGIVYDSKEQYEEAIKCYNKSIGLCSKILEKIHTEKGNQGNSRK